MSSFYSLEELKKLGLKFFGENVLISKKCSIYGAANISVGNNVRIDDFCIMSGTIEIGNYVHISAYSALYARAGIKIGNFCGISPRSTIYTSSDDFSGEYMISPMVPAELTNLVEGKVTMEDFSQLGANTIIMPKVTLYEGAVTGALSLVLSDLEAWSINIGTPAKKHRKRDQNVKELAKKIKG